MRRTKIVCTIGPKTCRFEHLQNLIQKGMNIARLNMSHSDHSWHRQIISFIKTLNQRRDPIALMLDTKGPEIRSGDLRHEVKLRAGDTFTFTIRRDVEHPLHCTEVNYDGFVDDVKVGDTILVDGGLITLIVRKKNATDIICECMEGGTITSRRHLNIRGKSAKLPSITEKDWEDIRFGLKEGVDFIALSFVKDAQTILELKQYLEKNKYATQVIAKIESASAIEHLEEIVAISDGIMVARGDLGAELPFEEVPLIQEKIIQLCQKYAKPVIVATHLLESMVVHPTPTRAEVSDIARAVEQRADAVMLSAETATGNYPMKVVGVIDTVAKRIEQDLIQDKYIQTPAMDDPKYQIVWSAAMMANNLNAKAILVITRSGYMAELLSHCRPCSPIFAFTNTPNVRRRLNLYWGVFPYRIDFSSDPEKTIQRGVALLKSKKMLQKNDRIVVISDILAGREFVETIQMRQV